MKISLVARHIISQKAKIVAAVIVGAISLTLGLSTSNVSALTPMSADALPTVKVNDGMVWAQAIRGNTVYATGCFSSVTDVGSATPVTRIGLLAYDITTGKLVPNFNHSLHTGAQDCRNGQSNAPKQGRAIAISPDGRRLVVGGSFTTVDGQARSKVAVFDLTVAGGSLLGGYSGVTDNVTAVEASNTYIYVAGGSSVRAYAIASGNPVAGWPVTANAKVSALTLTPDASKLVIGGSFTKLNNQTYYALGAVQAITGVLVPWASKDVPTLADPSQRPGRFPINSSDLTTAISGITSLSADTKYVYFTSFFFGAYSPGKFEGRAAIQPSNGALVWLNDCHGDSYDTFPINGTLFSAGHAHDCWSIGAFPEASPVQHHGLAETTEPSGTNLKTLFPNFENFQGQPRSTQLNWYPKFNYGIYSGASQAGWSVVATSDYVAYGGEFSRVNGQTHLGLVRFTTMAKSPKSLGPVAYANPQVVKQGPPIGSTVTVTWPTTKDPDDGVLSYALYRVKNGVSTYVATVNANSPFWVAGYNTVSYRDTSWTPGSTYRVVAKGSGATQVTAESNTTPTACRNALSHINTLCRGEGMINNQALVSNNGRYSAVMQADGNFVVYDLTTGPIWYTYGKGMPYYTFSNMRPSYLNFQGDGNVVIYDSFPNSSPSQNLKWHAGTYADLINPALWPAGERMVMQDDGNLVIYAANGKALWDRAGYIKR